MPTNLTILPKVIADHVAACNDHNTDAMMATFAADAFVNDAGREFIDRPAIQRWIEEEIIGPKVTMEVAEAVVSTHAVILRVKVDGEYDKTGLPDPLVLVYHFAFAGGHIDQLVISLNKPNQ